MKLRSWLFGIALAAMIGAGAAGCGDDDDGAGGVSGTELHVYSSLPL